jgi:acyl-CoA thioesterase-1
MSIAKVVIPVVIVIAVVVTIGVMMHSTKKPSAEPVATAVTTSTKIRYLPLGDSYTIGQSVSEADRYPNQLVARLQQDKVSISILANPSVTGYTTQDLINNELPLLTKLKPNFVTLLIGVNDYVQGVSIRTFQTNLNYILDAIQKELPNPKQLVLVTIPDFGKTPTGSQFGDPAQLESGVEAFNAVITADGKQRGLPVADIFPASQEVSSDPSLIASDGLHPSGKQYALWTNVIYAAAKPLLEP